LPQLLPPLSFAFAIASASDVAPANISAHDDDDNNAEDKKPPPETLASFAST
jgi:hypothetical protein